MGDVNPSPPVRLRPVEDSDLDAWPRAPTWEVIARFAMVGVIVAGVGLAFGYTGGWLTPHALTPPRLIDTFEQLNGVSPGFRRNHAKGVCVSGYFDSNGRAAHLSRAAIFRVGRF